MANRQINELDKLSLLTDGKEKKALAIYNSTTSKAEKVAVDTLAGYALRNGDENVTDLETVPFLSEEGETPQHSAIMFSRKSSGQNADGRSFASAKVVNGYLRFFESEGHDAVLAFKNENGAFGDKNRIGEEGNLIVKCGKSGYDTLNSTYNHYFDFADGSHYSMEVKNGSGTVSTVNSVQTDSEGNVELTAENIEYTPGRSLQEYLKILSMSKHEERFLTATFVLDCGGIDPKQKTTYTQSLPESFRGYHGIAITGYTLRGVNAWFLIVHKQVLNIYQSAPQITIELKNIDDSPCEEVTFEYTVLLIKSSLYDDEDGKGSGIGTGTKPNTGDAEGGGTTGGGNTGGAQIIDGVIVGGYDYNNPPDDLWLLAYTPPAGTYYEWVWNDSAKRWEASLAIIWED